MSTPRKAATASTSTPEKPTMSRREVEDIQRGELYHGAGDASPKERAARQKAEQRIRAQNLLIAEAEPSTSHTTTHSPRPRKGGKCTAASAEDYVEVPSSLEADEDARAPSPTPSTTTVVAHSPEPESTINEEEAMKKPSSFVTAPEPPSTLVSAAPSLIIQPGGLLVSSSAAPTNSPLSIWEKLFLAICVTPIIIAAMVKAITTSTSSYFELSAMSRDSARTLSPILHGGIDLWLVPFARLCLDLFEELVVPTLHVVVNVVVLVVAYAVHLLLFSAVFYTCRTLLLRRRTASA
ncbi:hypothetical protein EXIGLDRAFT_768234 [Exidia glandulosa HHB12029]|uniref:Transmembrane protein n=1 Tax=Exidia glandulosa HHB12029 TaxID=1314781 RepID=A0A165ICQ8_EXIGL|nr:hypothetical protein EXIGLDRAFT_768234 [Exidia glandulosa HHB12029]